MNSCVFCRICETPSTQDKILRRYTKEELDGVCDVIVIQPLNPVTVGHLLFIPTIHVKDFSQNPNVSAATMKAIALYSQENYIQDCNVITSRGEVATQSVFHLHMHLVPRFDEDGLHLPWTNQIIGD